MGFAKPVLVVMAATGLAAPARGQELPDLAELLAPRVVEAEVIEPRLHPEAQEVLDKMAEANRDNTSWLMQYMARPQSGQALLYEPLLGVTRSEFERYEVYADSGSLHVSRRARLEIEATGSGVVLRSVDLPDLDGVRIDVPTGFVRTARWTLEEAMLVDGATLGTPANVWDGIEWSRTVEDPNNRDVVQERLAVGRLRASGMVVIHYSLRERRGPLRSVVDQVVRF